MVSVGQLLQKIADPNLNKDERALLRCQLAKRLEETGRYEAAREALGELWSCVGERPELGDLRLEIAATVLLRVGVLTGWLGSAHQIEGSQEVAKNLISESLEKFKQTGERKGAAEAQAELGYCYWREGAFDEARVLMKDALALLSDDDEELKAVILLRLALVEKVAYKTVDALQLLTEAAPLFSASDNNTLKGRFHNEYAQVLRKLGEAESRGQYIDRALIEYAAASYHFEQGGHTRYQACVENNLGFLFSNIGKYEEAHTHLDRAQALLTSLRDEVHLAQTDETRARVYLAEGKVVEAERVARAAVGVLERGGEQALLAEALTTQGVALARLGRGEAARQILHRAIEVAERAGDREGAGQAALAVVEELFAQLGPEELRASFERADGLLAASQHPVNHRRLLACARRLLFRFDGVSGPPTWEGVQLDRFVTEFEGRLVERALRAAGGVITRAAQFLGIKRQRLSNMLHTRHRRLLAALSPDEVKREAQMRRLDASEQNRRRTSPACCSAELPVPAGEEN
jgi:tetratricopeptide (TPR) repeat protein